MKFIIEGILGFIILSS